ncbi:hypothetical protein DL546_001726 [Coniochaeta pulveracea]|uniref:Uncharacterized protein n=1 Tax=Coniochaeta pulveracea TaxID=177199 RepID=A0A420Y783_9PEZI|nr:hypothetical protein DL546_001726 [Coniochaeta pulveracea]
MNRNSDGSLGIPGLPGYSPPVPAKGPQGADRQTDQGKTIKVEPDTVSSDGLESLTCSVPATKIAPTAAFEACIPIRSRPQGPPKTQDVVKLNYGQGGHLFHLNPQLRSSLMTNAANGQEGSSSPPFPRYMTYNGAPRDQSHDNRSQVYSGNDDFATRVQHGSFMTAQRSDLPVALPMDTSGGRDSLRHQARTLPPHLRTLDTRGQPKPTDTPQAIPSFGQSRPLDGSKSQLDRGQDRQARMTDQERRNISAHPQASPISNYGNRLSGGTRGLFVFPTQVLSSECQKRGFNPIFRLKESRVMGKLVFNCNVELRDKVITSDELFDNAQEAKFNVANKALAAISAWPPATGANLNRHKFMGFEAVLDVNVDEATACHIHSKLYAILFPRKFTLCRHSSNANCGLLLCIPDGWNGHNITVKMDARWSINFRPFDLKAACDGCQAMGSRGAHSHDTCPMWVEVGTRHSESGGRSTDNSDSLPHAPRGNTGAPEALAAQVIGDKQGELVRSIQELMGGAAMSGDSQDPHVKTAFLEGIALGARLAASAPGPVNTRSHSRSRSPQRRSSVSEHGGAGTDRYPRRSRYTHIDRYAPEYRQRSPLRTASRWRNAAPKEPEGVRDGASGASKPPESAPRGPALQYAKPWSSLFPRRP